MEREVHDKEATHSSSVEDLPFTNERAAKYSNLESRKASEGDVKKIEETPSKTTSQESKNKGELQITEELDQFAEVGQKNNSDSGENPTQFVPKPTKRNTTEAKSVPKGTAVKKKVEPKNVGPVRDDDAPPWNGITLNRCLVVAAVLALLSVGFQVLQDVVDTDDDLPDIETGVWTSNDTTEQLPEPWFYEGWFGTSQPKPHDDPGLPELLETEDLPEEDMEAVEVEEETEDIEEEVIEDITEYIESVEETEETSTVLDLKECNNSEEDKHQPKQTDKWGLKAKNKYMQTKALKIRRATDDGSKKRAIFPFTRKPRESKIPKELKEKLFKEKSHKQKDKERRYEHTNKLEGGKAFKKGREESSKYIKHDKGKKELKEIKGIKEHKHHKEYRKQHNGRHAIRHD